MDQLSTAIRVTRAIFLLALLAIRPPTGSAQGAFTETGSLKQPVQAGLVSEQTSIQPATPFWVALSLRMAPDWHVYWKNPGDAGLPTTLDWSLPPGFSVGPLQWPIPERIESQGLLSYGYSAQVLLLARITPPAGLRNGQEVTLKARASWLACRVECTPGSAQLTLSMPVRSEAPTPDATMVDAFSAARALLPGPAPSVAFSARAEDRSVLLSAGGLSIPRGARIAFYPAVAGSIKDSTPPEVRLANDTLAVSMDLAPDASALGMGTRRFCPSDKATRLKTACPAESS